MPTAVITGSNRGIGLEYCRQLIAAGYSVIALCRRASEELKALDLKVEEGIDVGDDACIDEIRKRLAGVKIDLLINNAGQLIYNSIENPGWDEIRTQFEVNAMGPIRVVHALLENLNSPSKIAMTTSRMGSIADNGSGSSYGYRMSKAALNIASASMAKDLADKNVSVAILHPGYVRTEMTSMNGHIDPEESVRGMIKLIEGLNMENSGTFWHTNGEVLPW